MAAPTVPDPSADESLDARWLTGDEREVWLGLVRILATLAPALDAQLQRDAELTFFEYTVLAMLSEQQPPVLRMSQLAAVTNGSLSRLSHVAKRLEARGLMRRAIDPDDGRCTNASLTDAGRDLVRQAAPRHVAEVRRLVFDPLTATQLRQLGHSTERILAQVDPQAATRPLPPL